MAPKENMNEEDLTRRHLRARQKKRRKTLLLAIGLSAAVIIGITLGVTALKSRVSDRYGSSNDSGVEAAEVTVGSISETVSGSGTLESEEVESLDILGALEIEDFYVSEGDTVSEGDLIATVTSGSLVGAMSELQDEISELDAEIEDASDEEISSTIAAGVSGRVKRIYTAADDDVATDMYEYGALMLLSLDGYMAVDIETDTLAAGDAVTVTTNDGTEYSGLVEKCTGNVAVILVTDNGTEYEAEVTVSDSEGNEIGSGALYIHSSAAITGYAGTVDSISVSENEAVSAGDTLITLTDTETSANFDSLLKERAEIEDKLNGLIEIYQNGGICAGEAGVVSSLYDADSDTASVTSESTFSVSGVSTSSEAVSTGNASDYITAATISSSEKMSVTISIDESDILYISEGQTAEVTVSSVSDEAFTGTVSEISTTASSSSGVTTYTAVVEIEKTEGMLSGMSASVVIIIEGVDDALLIPVDALHQTSSTSYVYTEYDEETGELSGMVEVETGLINSSYVEITSGLSEGDTVYYTASSEESMDMFGSFGENPFGDSEGGQMPGGGSFSPGDIPSGGSMPQMPGGN